MNSSYRTRLSCDKTHEVINQLLLSRAITGVSFNFIPRVEVEIPRGWKYPQSCLGVIRSKLRIKG